MQTGILTPSEAATLLLSGYELGEGRTTPEQFLKKIEAVVLAHLIESGEKERLLGLSTK